MRGEGACRRALRPLATALVLLAAGIAQGQPSAAPPPQVASCVACHGADGNSPVPVIPSLAGQPRLFLENQLVLIREGLRVVPQMQGLLDRASDAELQAMAQYFAAQRPVAAPGTVDTPTWQRGQALAQQMLCASCHKADYTGREQIPRLAGQHEAFLLESMKQLRDRPGPGRDTIMAAALLGLKDQQLADLAHYLAHFR